MRSIAFLSCPKTDGPIDFFSQSAIFISNASDYGLTDAHFLTAAANGGPAPGLWSCSFQIRIPVNAANPNQAQLDAFQGQYAGYPWKMYNTPLVNLPGAQLIASGLIADNSCPWPFPLVGDGNNSEPRQPYSHLGVKFIDQFGQPYAIFVDPVGGPATGGDAIRYHNDLGAQPQSYPFVSVDNPISVECTFGGENEGFLIPLTVKNGVRLQCYPQYTWDPHRMKLIADWFNQWPAKITMARGPGYPNSPTGFEKVIVDGTLAINPDDIFCSNLHWTLDRPLCKFAGVLEPCS